MTKWLPAYVAFGMLTATGSVLAADYPIMPLKGPPAMAQPASNWGGCYVGGYGGGAWERNGATFTDLGPSAPSTATPPFLSYSGGSVASRLVPPHSWNIPVGDGGIFGATGGCNWQPMGTSWVLGFEGEAGYISLNGKAYDPNTLVSTQTQADVLGISQVRPWDASITGRLGFTLWQNTLLYAKGGVAFVRTSGAVQDNCQPGGTTIAGSPAGQGAGCGNWLINTQAWQTSATWTVGGGLEWMFAPNWSVKGEYMFIGLNNNSGFQSCGNAISPSGTVVSGSPFCFNHSFGAIGTAKIGLNYHLNWP